MHFFLSFLSTCFYLSLVGCRFLCFLVLWIWLARSFIWLLVLLLPLPLPRLPLLLPLQLQLQVHTPLPRCGFQHSKSTRFFSIFFPCPLL